jgi:glycosyltransferase involved in cell wall biosynthesis
MPVISIIVPVYKVEPYLRRCVDSILVQTFTDFECILVDDGSPDNCPAICDEYAKKDSRIVVIHQKNKGVSAARNAGLDRAQGDWIGFVDSDDWCDKGMYETLYKNARRHDADVSICGVRTVSINGDITKTGHKKHIRIFNGTNAIMEMLAPDSYGGFSWNKLVKFSLIKHYQVKYDETKKYMEDVLFFYTLFKNIKRVVYSSAPYYNYMKNVESVTCQLGLTKAAMTGLSVFDAILSAEHNKKIKRRVTAALVFLEKDLCIHYIKTKNSSNENYLFLTKKIRDKLPCVLINFSVPVKEKLMSWLVLYPSLFNTIYLLYKKLIPNNTPPPPQYSNGKTSGG